MKYKQGRNPNSIKNLLEGQKPIRTKERAKMIGSLGGAAFAKNNQKRKTLKEILEQMLNTKPTDEQIEILKKRYPEIDVENVNKNYAIIASLISKAISGDVSAFLALRDTLGEKPIDRIEATNINAEVDIDKIKELRKHLNDK
jgi:hypothetical protein